MKKGIKVLAVIFILIAAAIAAFLVRYGDMLGLKKAAAHSRDFSRELAAVSCT